MKTPICAFDAKTGILCPKCETRLKGGHISKLDVDVSVKLTKLRDKIPELDRISLVRAQEVEGDIVLVFASGDLAYLRSDPTIQKRIEEGLSAKVLLVEGETTDRKMLEDLFYPIRILTVNVVWLPDGSKLTKVIIPGRRTERFPINTEMIKKVVKLVRGIDLLVEFEVSTQPVRTRPH
jgi:transcription antitermination factor NusA-like protein